MIPLNSKQIVSLEELLISQVVQQEALTRLLVEKGVFSKEDFLGQGLNAASIKHHFSPSFSTMQLKSPEVKRHRISSNPVHRIFSPPCI